MKDNIAWFKYPEDKEKILRDIKKYVPSKFDIYRNIQYCIQDGDSDELMTILEFANDFNLTEKDKEDIKKYIDIFLQIRILIENTRQHVPDKEKNKYFNYLIDYLQDKDIDKYLINFDISIRNDIKGYVNKILMLVDKINEK